MASKLQGSPNVPSNVFVHGSVHSKDTVSTRGELLFRDAASSKLDNIRAKIYSGKGKEMLALNVSLGTRTTSFHENGDVRLEGYSLNHGMHLFPKEIGKSARLELQNNPPKDQPNLGTTFILANALDGSFDIRSSFVRGGLWLETSICKPYVASLLTKSK